MKPFARAALGALSALMICGAASAQSAKSVNEAYQAGRALGVSPETASEMTLCAAYWEVWRQSAERDWEPSFIDALDPALTAEEADFASYYWANEAQATYEERDEDLSAYDAQVTVSVNQATKAYDRLMLLMPEPLKIFETLGTCQIP